MVLKPKRVEAVTDGRLLAELESGSRPGMYAWEFPVKTFDGSWWALQVSPEEWRSAQQSYRNQAHKRFNRRSSAKLIDGSMYVRVLASELVDPEAAAPDLPPAD